MRYPTTVILLLILAVVSVSASEITLETGITPNYSNGDLDLKITILSKGDEAAFNLAPILIVDGIKYPLERSDQLVPGRSLSYDQKIDAPINIGTYPVLLKINYTDANGYQFQVIAAATFDVIQGTGSKLLIIADDLKINKASSLTMTLKNNEDEPIEGRIRYSLPDGFSSGKDEDFIYLKQGEELRLNVFIKRETALPGSTYYIYLIGEYDLLGRHYSQITPVRLSVPTDVSLDTRLISRIIVALCIVLLAIYLYYKIRFRS